MANVIIPKSLWAGTVPLPKVCIACGKPATGEATIKTNLEPTGVAGNSLDHTSALGCLFFALEMFSFARSIAARESRLCLIVPVCRYHGWISPPNVTIVSDNAHTVELSGVSSEFIALLPKHADKASDDGE